MRTHYCGELNRSDIDQQVTLCGWAHRRRDHGGVIFIDLREGNEILQVVVEPQKVPAVAIELPKAHISPAERAKARRTVLSPTVTKPKENKIKSGSRPCSQKRRVENMDQGSKIGRDLGEFDQGSRIGRNP